MTTQNDERDRAKQIFIDALKAIAAEKIEGETAFEGMVTVLREWGLQQEDGPGLLLNVAAHLQRCAYEQQVLARMAPVPVHTAN